MIFNAYYMGEYYGEISAPSRSAAIDFFAEQLAGRFGGPCWRPSIQMVTVH